jgi:hypothetical protein
MTRTPITRASKALAFLAILLAVLILLVPPATDHHTPVLLFLFVPIFLFTIPDALAPQPLPSTVSTTPHHPPTRPTLFQRPPPHQS